MSKKETGSGFRVREAVKTPNPNALKLVLDRIISAETLSFRSREAAIGNPLASQLFELAGVVGLLFVNDFVTISKSPEARWADITTKAKRILAKG